MPLIAPCMVCHRKEYINDHRKKQRRRWLVLLVLCCFIIQWFPSLCCCYILLTLAPLSSCYILNKCYYSFLCITSLPVSSVATLWSNCTVSTLETVLLPYINKYSGTSKI